MAYEAADRTRNVTYAIRDIAVLAKKVEKQKPVLYLNIGDPDKFDFGTPSYLIDAENAATKAGKNFYSDSQGVPEAVSAIVAYNNKLGITTDESHVMVTSGVSEAVNILVASMANKGENWIIPRPSYPVYTAYLNLFEAEPRFYTLDEDRGWELDIDDIERQITDRTKAIVIINPNNPTGAVYDKKTLQELVGLAAERKLVIISDEIYDEMILEGNMYHIAEFSGDVPVVTFNGLAKNFLAPGWRTGWLSITDREHKIDDITEAVMKLGRARLCSGTPQQYAIKPALEGERPHLRETLSKLRKRRDITYERINSIDGLSLVKPQAAFYAFPRIDFEIDDRDFVTGLLEEEGVATVHGSGFDMAGHFRIVYLPSESILNEAFDKIERYVKRIRR